MLHFSKFKIAGIGLILFLGFLFSVPNFFSEQTRLNWPQFLPSNALNLGLDLQGGSHLLLEVDTAKAEAERIDSLVSDVRNALRGEKIKYSGLGVKDNAVEVRILRPEDIDRAQEALAAINNPILGNIFAGGVSNNEELEIEQLENRFRIGLSDASRAQRVSQTVQQSIEIIRRRVDELGTTEPAIQRQGENRILVQVPGLQNPERLKALLGQTAKLNFHLVDPDVSAYEVLSGKRKPVGTMIVYTDTEPPIPYLVQRRAMVNGERLVDASLGFDPQTNAPEVNFRFDTIGARKFGDVTQANVGRPFAIVLDEKIISAPVIQSPILGGSGRITGSFTVQEANDLSILLRAGALPAPMQILEERTVGPSLGADSIASGRLALIVGFIAVIVFMMLSYNLFGAMANIALILNLVLIMAVLSALQATLTLPGIAGIVLTVGMAVDANVLIFERIREELADGTKALIAIDKGYERALGTILDANITTFLAAIILFQLGSGPVRGFAVTLAIGVVTSVFTAFVLTRLFIVLWVQNRRKLETLPL